LYQFSRFRAPSNNREISFVDRETRQIRTLPHVVWLRPTAAYIFFGSVEALEALVIMSKMDNNNTNNTGASVLSHLITSTYIGTIYLSIFPLSSSLFYFPLFGIINVFGAHYVALALHKCVQSIAVQPISSDSAQSHRLVAFSRLKCCEMERSLPLDDLTPVFIILPYFKNGRSFHEEFLDASLYHKLISSLPSQRKEYFRDFINLLLQILLTYYSMS